MRNRFSGNRWRNTRSPRRYVSAYIILHLPPPIPSPSSAVYLPSSRSYEAPPISADRFSAAHCMRQSGSARLHDVVLPSLFVVVQDQICRPSHEEDCFHRPLSSRNATVTQSSPIIRNIPVDCYSSLGNYMLLATGTENSFVSRIVIEACKVRFIPFVSTHIL